MGFIENNQLSTEDKKNIKIFFNFYLKQKDRVLEEVTNLLKTNEKYKLILKSEKINISEVGISFSQETAIVEDKWEKFFEPQFKLGEKFSILGLSLQSCLSLTSEFKDSFLNAIDFSLFKSNIDILDFIFGMQKFFDSSLLNIAEGFINERQTIINAQQKVIQELSHPILKLREKLLVLPLIGILDSVRAKQMTKDLLYAIKYNKAKIIILDITGVPIVDTKVANHLIETTKAVNLMGGKIILTGISPEVAQTLVTLGAELTGIETFLDLESGLEVADQILGIKLIKK